MGQEKDGQRDIIVKLYSVSAGFQVLARPTCSDIIKTGLPIIF
jgi:hypothetical protein